MKLKGLIEEIKPVIEKLRKKGFYLNNDLIDKLLKDMEEK